MNYQEKVAWLGRYQTALSCQRMLEEEITVLRSDAARVTACMSGMPGRSGPDANRLPRAVEHIEDAQKRLAQQRQPFWCGIAFIPLLVPSSSVQVHPELSVVHRPVICFGAHIDEAAGGDPFSAAGRSFYRENSVRPAERVFQRACLRSDLPSPGAACPEVWRRRACTAAGFPAFPRQSSP